MHSLDVIVIGAGSAGLTAATQAARAGARTLLIDKSGVLGGTTVAAAVNFPGLFHAWGRQIIAGYGWQLVRAAVAEMGDPLPDFSEPHGRAHSRHQILVNPAAYAALADTMVCEAGCEVLLHTLLAAADPAEDGWRLTLCGKEGLAPVRCRVLIDCTGDANAVALAGLPLHRNAELQPGTLALRAVGYDRDALDLPALEAAFLAAVERGELHRSDLQLEDSPVAYFLRLRGANCVHVVGIDGSTSAGRTEAELKARALMLRLLRFFRRQPGLEALRFEFFATECGIRESRTIEGEVRVTGWDYTSGRLWEDALCYSYYPIDVHRPNGIGIEIAPLAEGVVPTMPLRALLPRGSRHLLVAGRCASGDQVANSAFRVQASCMAMGQAAGAVAALAVRLNREVRDVPLDDIRALLRAHGAIVPPAIEAVSATAAHANVS
ncbi:MAG: FAD-dependent oxidoreductase [Verrucomicrobia bacterium]|nr:FAD-dependent oxidoreductase [Verrucomicrobiota bacterium]